MADSVSSNPEQQRIHQEGTDYIKEQIHNNPSDGPQGKGTAPQPVTLPEPPASNPGADDASGGIPQGSGGVSGTAHIESPVQSSQESGGIIDTVKGLLGLKIQDSGEKKAEDTEQARNAADDTTTPAPSYIAGAAAATGATATSAQTFTADVPDRTRQTETTSAMNTEPTVTLDKQALGDIGKTFPSASADNNTTASSTSNRMDDRNTHDHKDSQPLPGRDASAPLGTETGGVADATKDGSEPQIGSAGHEEKEAASEKPPKSAANPKSMENRDAIPSAGGERLGDKHWGESKIVPDNPKPQNEAGVAASDNTDEVASNTAKNTGGATSGPHGEGEGKQKLTDKIKDKIPGLNKK